MSYPPDISGLLQEIRDTLNTNNDPTSQYDASEVGLLQNIRDLLNTGHASTAHYTFDINGLLTNIRDLLNTGNDSTAQYPPDQYGLWQSIRDFSNTGNASVASYPDSIFGLIQAARDFLSGGGSGYVAKAVHFDGSSYLTIPSLSATNSKIFSASLFFKPTSFADFQPFWVVDPEDTFSNYSDIGSSAGDGIPISKLGNADLGSCCDPSSSLPCILNQWNSIVYTANQQTKETKMYLNRVDVTSFADGVNEVTTFNGYRFVVGTDLTYNFHGAMALFWLSLSDSLLTDGDISPETLAKFVDANNKPVDPSGYPSNGLVFLNGDANTFATNNGSGGSPFTVVGALTNATTSPSD